ncbi:tetratricopeptide repeat protein [Chitinimonas sp.]|uniref:tetratricopeptide repeat protein n=1 Tax=Chitinimonas sp. TaxID=1934313 RepID=UPI0035AF1F9C
MRSLFGLILLLGSLLAWATPTQDEVKAAIGRGDYAAAETMMRQVVTDKPGSAKAHFIYAEILAHNGRFGEATDQALQAKRLDPAIHFTSPDKFRAFEAKLLNSLNKQNQPPARVDRPVAEHAQAAPRGEPAKESSSSLWLWIALFVLIGGGLYFILSRRSNTVMQPAGMGGGFGGGQSYGGGGGPTVINNGMGGGSGIGAGIGGFAAGVAAAELYEHFAHGSERERERPLQNPGYYSEDSGNRAEQSLRNDPIDFGNGSSWDDSSSGGSSFDSGSSGGGSSDW